VYGNPRTATLGLAGSAGRAVIDLSRRASMRILEGVAFVAFVYYGATRGVTEEQALFLADGLEGRYAASPVALRLAKRIREEAAARRARDIELADMEKYELLRFLDQVAFDRMLETELLELQAMLRGERRPGEQPPSA
jgi:hypothetical protein